MNSAIVLNGASTGAAITWISSASMTIGVRSVSVAGAEAAACPAMIHFEVNAEMKLLSPGLPFRNAIAPRPPPSGLAITGQLSVRIF